MLTLYHYVPVANGGKVLIALHEKGLEFTSRWVDLHKFEQHSPEYLAINAEGQVPTLIHDGAVVVHTSVINEYLEDAFPDTPRLRPTKPLDVARMRSWNKYIDDHVMQAVSVHGWQVSARKIAQALSDDEFDAHLARIPLKAQRDKWRTARGRFPQEKLDECTTTVREAVARVEAQLVEAGGPWLLGSMFTLADINFYSYCAGALVAMFPEIGTRENCPRLLDWIERMEARPGVAAAMAVRAP